MREGTETVQSENGEEDPTGGMIASPLFAEWKWAGRLAQFDSN
jgi:hypothetical protein